MFFLFIGLGFFVAGIILFFQWQKTIKKIHGIKDTDTSTVAQLQEMSNAIAQELGTVGAFKEQVEVKGIITSNNPLIAELSQRPCIYTKMRVIEKYEEIYYETDEEGNRQRRTRQGSTTLADNTLQISFQLDDGTGKIQVNPNEAEIEAIEVVNSYELYQNQSSLSLGAFNLNLSISSPNSANKRILGHQYNEWILPVDSKIYLLGEITDSDGHLLIHKPIDKNNRFLITYKSEEELLQSKESQVKTQKIWMITCSLIGIICMIIGLLTMNS